LLNPIAGDTIMTARMAMILAKALGGEFHHAMPESRQPGFTFVRRDGKFVSIETDARGDFGTGYVYASREDHERHQTEGLDVGSFQRDGWEEWGSRDWSGGFANLIDGESEHSGGGTWLVNFVRPDGKIVVIGEEGLSVWTDAAVYESQWDDNPSEAEEVYWFFSE
jgi:hypothetical protein